MGIRVFLLLGLFHLVQSKVWNLSCAQIKVLIDGHNERRLMVANGEVPYQPPAAEMNSVVWDKELAAKAEEMASTYPWEFMVSPNDKLTKSFAERFEVVSSIISSVPVPLDYKLNLNDTLNGWFETNQFYTFGPWNNYHPSGFYTQMVWSDSIYLGCAVSEKQIDVRKMLYFVCNYGPGGNVLGQLPYKPLPSDHGRGRYEKLECRINDCSHPYGSAC